jgi:hypothetical protein
MLTLVNILFYRSFRSYSTEDSLEFYCHCNWQEINSVEHDMDPQKITINVYHTWNQFWYLLCLIKSNSHLNFAIAKNIVSQNAHFLKMIKSKVTFVLQTIIVHVIFICNYCFFLANFWVLKVALNTINQPSC